MVGATTNFKMLSRKKKSPERKLSNSNSIKHDDTYTMIKMNVLRMIAL